MELEDAFLIESRKKELLKRTTLRKNGNHVNTQGNFKRISFNKRAKKRKIKKIKCDDS